MRHDVAPRAENWDPEDELDCTRGYNCRQLSSILIGNEEAWEFEEDLDLQKFWMPLLK